ncbi:MAG: hypothetical protein K0S58_3608 [Nitrospira sp.]|jgi:hypothetical protein|nr:hypothetical protein [Nitrospira sp.]
MACARCSGLLVIEVWGVLDNVREKRLPKMRCVNCGSIEDSVILENRLIERSAICCTMH